MNFIKKQLIWIAENSKSGKDFDIKSNESYAPFKVFTGTLLNGKYATARSVGNYLAAYNASTGTFWKFSISFDTFMRLAGALHKGYFNSVNAAEILLDNRAYGRPPWYGEIEYAGRMMKKGWDNIK